MHRAGCFVLLCDMFAIIILLRVTDVTIINNALSNSNLHYCTNLGNTVFVLSYSYSPNFKYCHN